MFGPDLKMIGLVDLATVGFSIGLVDLATVGFSIGLVDWATVGFSLRFADCLGHYLVGLSLLGPVSWRVWAKAHGIHNANPYREGGSGFES